jgi:hypothetical protein
VNIPVGEIIEENVSLKDVNIGKKLSELMNEKVTGYIVLTVEGRSGIEEGLGIIKDGILIGGIYEYIRFGKIIYGDTAMAQLLNSGLAEFGVMDIGRLSKQQIELIIAFNERIELKNKLSQKELLSAMPKKYNAGSAETELVKGLKKKESKFDILKRIGLGGVR